MIVEDEDENWQDNIQSNSSGVNLHSQHTIHNQSNAGPSPYNMYQANIGERSGANINNGGMGIPSIKKSQNFESMMGGQNHLTSLQSNMNSKETSNSPTIKYQKLKKKGFPSNQMGAGTNQIQ